MSTMRMVNQRDMRNKNRRLGLILALVTLLYIGAVIGFIIVY